jgi:L-asparaginase / beta-aspartyl-peptidase
VLYLKHGYALEDACREAFRDLGALGTDPAQILMSMVALDRHGNHCAVTTSTGRSYVYQADGMSEYVALPRIVIEVSSQ